MRYQIEKTHKYYLAVKDTMAPKGAQVVKYWNDTTDKNIKEANSLKDKLNKSWHKH